MYDLEDFRRNLEAEGVLWDEGFAEPSAEELGKDFCNSLIINCRNSILEGQKLQIAWVGEFRLRPRKKDVDFVTEKEMKKELKMKHLFGNESTIKPLESYVAGFFATQMKEDRLLKKFRKKFCDKANFHGFVGLMLDIWVRVVHDALCGGQEVVLKSIGTLKPFPQKGKIEFIKDEYMKLCLKSIGKKAA
ncbi:hypothetical protein A2926_01135 [Candidatus Giovannonibacteria bacterium RIFCSPLOWO2_01_FULL_44_40]|uniref:Uncharacterized protein n=1 Tax=Candidatus Giovannonibacteria bacterium RIFCSPHIGHO2_01_FULL_45_23 TaxID=1798325 RepID=A0A1F5VHX1_9BACT|nr:MAG: hypothetical protein A2834_03150 [Candidatus Giovannonibacteria bacterium RIFCSPHIGHO2_01_FULL_45_23]OGF75629.1 MAG: hypothetical protein A3C77_01010 [Candidatus Giovannonibacteria bacterium RIFCSPHIGHO2_02_FULL_45_13]OGF79538.1 MAG: hypothetical protein A2926_01135 [Candidatus Giovannonibacteria bacterium RIFCSPLOWO2_01_FULL_44_40]